MIQVLPRVGRVFRQAAIVAAATAVPSVVFAQALPSAKELIAKYVAATGVDRWKSHKSSRMKATMDVPGAGMSATMEVMTVYPNHVYTKVDIAGMGTMMSGFDGTTAWSLNPFQGPRVMTSGPEVDALKADSDPAATYTRSSPDIVSSETVDKTTMNGQECYRVKHTFKSGRVVTDCFSVADGLIIAVMQKQTTPMGEMETTQLLSAYKDFGGIKRPTTIVQEAMGQQQIITVSAWEWDNVDPAKEFVIPPEIKAMMEKKP